MSVLVDVAILDRVVRIKYGNEVGSGLYVQLAGVCMILTAAHLVRGMQDGDRLGIRFKDDWHMLDVTGVAFCEAGTDVCAIRPRTHWGEGLHEDQLESVGLKFGEEVAYCGFPLSLEMQGFPGALGWPKGFVKAAILSGALMGPEEKLDCFLFDTINNRGFSGGPVVRSDNGKLKVVAIVSGYKYDAPSPVYLKRPDGTEEESQDYFVKPNSGFMKAIPISRAIACARRLIPPELLIASQPA